MTSTEDVSSPTRHASMSRLSTLSRALFEAGDKETLADLFMIASARFPNSRTIADRFARTLMESSRYAECYETSVVSFSKYGGGGQFALYASLCSSALGLEKRAHDWARRGVLLNPGSSEALRNLMALPASGLPEVHCDGRFDWVLTLDPADAAATTYFCYRLFKSGAANFFEKMPRMIARSGDPFWFRYYRAMIAELNGVRAAAREDVAFLEAVGDETAIATCRLLGSLDKSDLRVFADKHEIFTHGLARADDNVEGDAFIMEFGVSKGV